MRYLRSPPIKVIQRHNMSSVIIIVGVLNRFQKILQRLTSGSALWVPMAYLGHTVPVMMLQRR